MRLRVQLFYVVFGLALFSFVSCKNDPNSSKSGSISVESDGVLESIEKIASRAEENPSEKNVAAIFSILFSSYKSLDPTSDIAKKVLLKGTEYCKKYNNVRTSGLYYFPLLRDHYDPATAKDYLYKLIASMKALKKDAVVDVLASNYIKLYPTDGNTQAVKALISKDYVDMDTYLKNKEISIFKEKNSKIENDRKVREYVAVTEAFALSDPSNLKSPAYLYKGSELARSIKALKKVVSLYDWIMNKYPDFEKVSTVHFLKGFILENELGEAEQAKKVYQSFLQKYPKNELADDVQFLIDNIGKSNDEILKMLGKDK